MIEEKDQYNLLEAYFMEELKKWIGATRLGIVFGIDPAKPGHKHIYIICTYSNVNHLASDGVW